MEKNIVANQDDRHEAIREKYSLLVMISTQKKVEKMANYALANGANSAFFSYARGTLPNHILLALGLANVKREIAVLSVPNSMAAILLDRINQKFDLAEKMGGIAYLITREKTMTRPDVDRDHTYSAIVTIVNEGEGEDVVTNVRRKYYVGATILHASGSADHSRKTFDFEIVPSKEIVLIITKKSLVKQFTERFMNRFEPSCLYAASSLRPTWIWARNSRTRTTTQKQTKSTTTRRLTKYQAKKSQNHTLHRSTKRLLNKTFSQDRCSGTRRSRPHRRGCPCGGSGGQSRRHYHVRPLYRA